MSLENTDRLQNVSIEHKESKTSDHLRDMSLSALEDLQDSYEKEANYKLYNEVEAEIKRRERMVYLGSVDVGELNRLKEAYTAENEQDLLAEVQEVLQSRM